MLLPEIASQKEVATDTIWESCGSCPAALDPPEPPVLATPVPHASRSAAELGLTGPDLGCPVLWGGRGRGRDRWCKSNRSQVRMPFFSCQSRPTFLLYEMREGIDSRAPNEYTETRE